MNMKSIDKTKTKFEEALFCLLNEQNYHDITLNDICALAGKTKMTFYHYYKDKDDLLAKASINLINNEYNAEYEMIERRETGPEEIEYQSLIVTYEWVAKHYNQIRNLTYKGETLPLEIFKKALFDNYSSYLTAAIAAVGYDIPSNYMSIFCFEGLYGSSLYYAERLKNSPNEKEVRDEMKKVCRVLAKAVISITVGGEGNQ